MDLYYVINADGPATGPHPLAELKQMVKRGKIALSALVKQEGATTPCVLASLTAEPAPAAAAVGPAKYRRPKRCVMFDLFGVLIFLMGILAAGTAVLQPRDQNVTFAISFLGTGAVLLGFSKALALIGHIEFNTRA